MRALSAIHRCDYVAWSEILQASPGVVRLLPERTAVRLGAVPYGLEGRGLRVAFKNPSNLAAVDEVSAVTSRPVIPAVISEVRLVQALESLLRPAGPDRVSQRPPQAGAQRRAPALSDAGHRACRGSSRPEPVAARPRGVAAHSDRRGGRARGAGCGRARGGGSGSADSAADHSTPDDSSGYSSAPPTVRGSAAAPVPRAFRIRRDAVRRAGRRGRLSAGICPAAYALTRGVGRADVEGRQTVAGDRRERPRRDVGAGVRPSDFHRAGRADTCARPGRRDAPPEPRAKVPTRPPAHFGSRVGPGLDRARRRD